MKSVNKKRINDCVNGQQNHTTKCPQTVMFLLSFFTALCFSAQMLHSDHPHQRLKWVAAEQRTKQTSQIIALHSVAKTNQNCLGL
jgi:hypothetical protein